MNVQILNLDVHGPLALIGTEEVANRSLSWWLTQCHALAGIVVTERSQLVPRHVHEGRTFRHRQEERPVRVVHPVKGVNVNQVGFQVGVIESLSQATNVADPVLVLIGVSRRQIVELLLEPNLAAWSQLLLAVVQQGTELVVAEVLADPLHEDHVVLGPPDNLAEVQGIACVCLTDLNTWLLFGVLHVVRISIHDVNLVIWEDMAHSSSDPAAAAAKVKERSCPFAFTSGTDCFDSSYRVPDVIGTQVSAIVRIKPNFALLESLDQFSKSSLLHRHGAAVLFSEYDLYLLRRWFTLRSGLRRAVLWLVRMVLPNGLLAGTSGCNAFSLRIPWNVE